MLTSKTDGPSEAFTLPYGLTWSTAQGSTLGTKSNRPIGIMEGTVLGRVTNDSEPAWAFSPGLLVYDSAADGWLTPSPQNDYVTFGTETTLYGLSEMACSPMWLDFEMIAYVPQKANRMTLIEFDSGEDSSWFGKHAMISDIPNRNLGFGLSPIWDGKSAGRVQETRFQRLERVRR